MAYLVRIALAALLSWCAVAHALIPPSYEYTNSYQGPGVKYTSAHLACKGAQGSFSENWSATTPTANSGTCVNSQGSATGTNWNKGAASCPSNSSLVSGSCVCTSPYVENAGQTACVPPPDPEEQHCLSIVGSPAQASWPSTSMALTIGKSVCQTVGSYSCVTTMETTMCAGGDGGAAITCYGVGTVTGGKCTPSPAPDTPTAPTAPATDWPAAPPPGMCPGQVNGIDVVVPCSQTSTAAKKTEQTNDGAGNTTSKTENRSTTCNAAGSCTTTVTTTTTVNGGTPKTTTSSTTQGKGEFCAANRGAKECGDGDGSSFGGNCDASFVCTGDAVQCALTKEVHLQHCKLNKVTDESTLYGTEKGRDGDQTGDLPGNQTVPFGPASFDSSDAIGGAACIGDLTISHEWLSATLPLSIVCGPLLWFRGALLFIGGIAWLLIVFRRRG